MSCELMAGRLMGKRGFTLIEIILVIMLLGLLSGIAVTFMKPAINTYKFEATRKEMVAIKKAILGDPEIISNGARTSFGYVGDMGGLPPDTADNKLGDELAIKGSQPAWTYDETNMIGYGWNGPYIKDDFVKEDSEDFNFKYDAWGNDYVYSDDDYTNENGESVDGKLLSYGPDKASGGGDDLTIEILKSETIATVIVHVQDSEKNPIPNAKVTIYYPDGSGSLNSPFENTNASGDSEFNSVPFGIRSLYITAVGYSDKRCWIYVDKNEVREIIYLSSS